MKSRLCGVSRLLICCIVLILLVTGCKKEAQKKTSGDSAENDYETYVFFGSDSRSGEEDWSDNASFSDVIMLLSVNEEKGDARIISVYRDTMLDIAGDGSDFRKCNNAFANGGAYGAIDMLERNLDLQIEGYITANFMTVANAIDRLGGIEVDVEDQKTNSDEYRERGLTDVVSTTNSYIDEMNKIYGTDTPHLEKAGLQNLTGLQAVAYSRVRYTKGSDMRRTERQRNILALMAGKLKTADTDTQHDVLKQMYQEADTDLGENELMNIFDLLIGYDIENIGGFPFYMDGIEDKEKGDMLVPCDLITNVKELHAYLYDNDSYIPSATVSDYDELIKKETGLTAEDANEKLGSYGKN